MKKNTDTARVAMFAALGVKPSKLTKIPDAPNCITAIAKAAKRFNVTTEDVAQAFEHHDPHMVRIDLLEVLAGQTRFTADDVPACAYAAWKHTVDA